MNFFSPNRSFIIISDDFFNAERFCFILNYEFFWKKKLNKSVT